MDNTERVKRIEMLDDLKVINLKIRRVERCLNKLRAKRYNLKDDFNKLDRKLAMKKRIVLIPRGSKVNIARKPLTINEIKTIAIKLGVKITIQE